jgi:hypothetical protein
MSNAPFRIKKGLFFSGIAEENTIKYIKYYAKKVFYKKGKRLYTVNQERERTLD